MFITSNIDPSEVLGTLSDLEKEQLPFAIAQSLTRVAAEARRRIQQVMPEVFDRPTPQTIQAVLYRPARKNALAEGALVFIKDSDAINDHKNLAPARWLKAEVEGGKRADKGLEVALKRKGAMPRDAQTRPTQFAPLDAYGNLRGSFVVQMMSLLNLFWQAGFESNETARSRARKQRWGKKSPDYFIGRPEKRGFAGIWQRIDTAFGKAIRPIVFFIRPGVYKPRLLLSQLVDSTYKAMGPEDLRRSLDDAIRTAKVNRN